MRIWFQQAIYKQELQCSQKRWVSTFYEDFEINSISILNESIKCSKKGSPAVKNIEIKSSYIELHLLVTDCQRNLSLLTDF